MSFGENLDELVERSTNDLHAKHPSWERVRAGDIAKLVNGFAFKSRGFNDKEGTPIVRIRDVTRGSPGTFYRGPIYDPKMTFIENGQIAIGMDGDFNCRIWKGGRALLNQRVCTLQADENFYSQKFLSFALPGYLKLINDHTSSITVKHLSSLTVRDIPLPLPPLNEQRRVVEKIETLFARLDKGEEALREVQKLLARYRQSVLKAAVTGQLTADWRAENAHRLEHGRDLLARILKTRRETWEGRGKYKEPTAPDTAELPELPEGWMWASVEQVSYAVDYGTSAKCTSEPGGVPVLRMGNIIDGSLDLGSLKFLPDDHAEFPKLLLEPGDLLFNRTNSAELVGKTAVYHGTPEKCSYASYLIRVRLISVMADLASVFINSVFGRAWVKSVVSQQVGQANVNGSKLKALTIPLPPAEEQEEIIQRMTELFSRMDSVSSWCETELARSAGLRQSILKEAFAGRLVSQDPADEPAADLLARIKGDNATASKKGQRVYRHERA